MSNQQLPAGIRPSARRIIPVRPLNKGMFSDRAGQQIEDGGFVTLKEILVNPEGLRRRPGFEVIGNDETLNEQEGDFTDSVPVGLVTLWQRDAERIDILVTDEFLYVIDYHAGYAVAAYKAHDLSEWDSADGLTWVDDTTPGDFQQADGDFDLVSVGDYYANDVEGDVRKITAVSDDETIVVSPRYGADEASSSEEGHIFRTFQVKGTEYLPDWVYAYGFLYVCSRHQRIQQAFYGGGSPALSVEDFGGAGTEVKLDSHFWSAAAIGFWNERLYFGHTVEWDTDAMKEFRQRLRFSAALAPTNVTFADYIDLDYKEGRIVKILPLANLLSVYMEDTIYLGRPNNLANLPVTFDEVETGGIGLVGQHALVNYKDGHFFVGQDNIYYHSTRGLQEIGTPIIRESIQKCGYPWRILAAVDEHRNRVCFGFPTTSESISQVWCFNYLTRAWSYEEYSTTMVASSRLDTTLSIDGLSGTIDNLTGSIDGLGGSSTIYRSFVRERANKLDEMTRTGSSDPEGVISMVMETKDHDFNEPDTIHKYTRLGIKLEFDNDVAFGSALDFTLELSHNRGREWKNVGTLRVRAGMDEGHADFRVASPHCRARLTSSADVVPYTITEYTWDVTGGGADRTLGTQE